MYRIVLWAGVAVAAAGAVLTLVRFDEPGAAGIGAVAAVVLLVAAALCVRRAPSGFGPATAVLALVVAGVAGWAEIRTGWPGAGPATLVSGALVATAGVVVGTARPAPPPADARGPRLSGPWRAVVTTVLALVVAVGLAAAATPTVQRLVVSGSTATSTPAPTPAPRAGPLVERWRWDAGGPVRAVRAAGPGVVVVRGAELVGLDSRTGRELWTYERSGAGVAELAVSPDRRWVALSHALDDPLRGERSRLVTVLDAATGAVRWTLAVESSPNQITDRVVTTRRGGGLVAHDLETGATAWTADPPPRCDLRTTDPVPSVPGIVLTVRDCPGPVGGPRRLRTLAALDDVAGGPRWSARPDPIGPAARETVGLPVLAGGRLVATPSYAATVLDTATGAVRIPAAGPRQYYGREGAAVRLVEDTASRVLGTVDPATGRLVPSVACPGSTGIVTTADGTAALCRAGDGYEVRAGGAPPVPVVLTGSPLPSRSSSASGVELPIDLDGWLVPAPGAVVAGVPAPGRSGILVGLGDG